MDDENMKQEKDENFEPLSEIERFGLLGLFVLCVLIWILLYFYNKFLFTLILYINLTIMVLLIIKWISRGDKNQDL